MHLKCRRIKKSGWLIQYRPQNEADDQFVLAHHLMTLKFKVRGSLPGILKKNPQEYGPETRWTQAKVRRFLKVMGLMGLSGEYPVWRGRPGTAKPDERTAVPSEGADATIAEAMGKIRCPCMWCSRAVSPTWRPLTSREPWIVERMTAIWIGGGKWAEGGLSLILLQDIHAANVCFPLRFLCGRSHINAYKQAAVSLAELQ